MSKRIGLITSRMLQPDEVNKIKDTYDLHSVLPCTFDSLYTHYKQLYSYWIKENEDDDATGIGAAFLYDAQRFELRQNTNPHKKELCHRIMNYIQMSIEKWENIIRYLLNNGSAIVFAAKLSFKSFPAATILAFLGNFHIPFISPSRIILNAIPCILGNAFVISSKNII